jgi:hypothetical protein
MKIFLQSLLFLSCAVQGQQLTPLSKSNLGVVKTISIYSSDSSFFDDYPIDSLVEHLNLLNTKPGIVYYKNTNDDSKTGFGADYLVNLMLAKNESEFVIPKVKRVAVTKPVMRAIKESGGSVRYEITEAIDHYENTVEYAENKGGYYYLSMQAFRKKPYKRFNN